MASTSKIAIAATFLEGVDRGRWTLDDAFPKMVSMPSKKFSSAAAPVKPGQLLPARELIEQALIHSNNEATDGLLAVVGGPRAVNDWARRAGIQGFSLDRNIATLVRDETEYDPSLYIDPRDSTTPLAMVQLLKGLHEGRWLSASSRNFLIGTMEKCVTGKNRIKARCRPKCWWRTRPGPCSILRAMSASSPCPTAIRSRWRSMSRGRHGQGIPDRSNRPDRTRDL